MRNVGRHQLPKVPLVYALLYHAAPCQKPKCLSLSLSLSIFFVDYAIAPLDRFNLRPPLFSPSQQMYSNEGDDGGTRVSSSDVPSPLVYPLNIGTTNVYHRQAYVRQVIVIIVVEGRRRRMLEVVI